jgi:hypothetical protein
MPVCADGMAATRSKIGAHRAAWFLLAVLLTGASCSPSPAVTRETKGPTTLTIWDTDYVRFEWDGVTYHAVPLRAGSYATGPSGLRSLQGPTYVRQEGDELWQCYPQGYHLPPDARDIMRGTRAPVTIVTMDPECR